MKNKDHHTWKVMKFLSMIALPWNNHGQILFQDTG